MITALVAAGIEGGYLANPRLAKVHWQAGNRPLPAPPVTIAGESALWVKPAEIPADDDISKLGQALASGRHGKRAELMANTAAYSGLRWGELTALTIPQVDTAARVIAVDRKVVEVAGHLYIEAPKNRKLRQTIYPRTTPGGYPLADELADRIGQARAEQEARHQPPRTDLPLPQGQVPAVVQLQPEHPPARLPGGRVARHRRQRPVDLAQPAARVLHHRPVHVEARRHRRVPHGRARQRPHHPPDVRRHHRRRPRPRPQSNRIVTDDGQLIWPEAAMPSCSVADPRLLRVTSVHGRRSRSRLFSSRDLGVFAVAAAGVLCAFPSVVGALP